MTTRERELLEALLRLMNQPTMSPLKMTVPQRKELWAAHNQARAAIEGATGRPWWIALASAVNSNTDYESTLARIRDAMETI